MASPQMVSRINQLSQSLGGVLGQIPLATLTRPEDAVNFLFEIKVLLSLLAHLMNNGWTVAPENVQGNQIRLAKSPGKKENFTFFKLHNTGTGESWQLVHGTQVEDPFGGEWSPDLSLQQAGADFEPTFRDVAAMWDAKFHGDDDALVVDRMSHPDYRSFVYLMTKLKVPRPGELGDPLGGWPPAFEVSGLITNGQKPMDQRVPG